MVVKSLKEKLRHRFEISVAEVGLQDVHQRARIGLSFVTGSRDLAQSLMEKIETFIDGNTDAVVNGFTSEILEFDEGDGA